MPEISLSMPSVFPEPFVPKVCETLDSRQTWLREWGPRLRLHSNYGHEGLEIWVGRDQKSLFFVGVADNDIHYFMRLNRLTISPRSIQLPPDLTKYGVYQGSVWRSDMLRVYGGKNLAKTLFWTLEKRNRIVWSDISQSRDGMFFWQDRIVEALDKGMSTVYAVEFDDQGTEARIIDYVPINGLRDARPFWTDETPDGTDAGLRWRFAIT